MFRDLRRDQTAFTDIAAHRTFGLNITFAGQTVSGEFKAVIQKQLGTS